MKRLYLFLLPLILFCLSCTGSVNKIFGTRKTPHEAYADKVEDSPAGQQWVAVSKSTLNAPQVVSLPYRHHGYFPTDKPRALALRFTAKQGERIDIGLIKNTGLVYADLFRQDGTNVSHMLAVDTLSSQFGFDANESGNYILRLQPELDRVGDYTLSIAVSPSLGFPVVGKKARTGSFWGDSRDGGQRRHEGIDIFAPKLTPAIAAADGYVTGVREGGIGGKTVWMRVDDRPIHLYYAHLDKQLVEEGQHIQKGDTLGLIGNTGNAKYTPPHLHFGVYGFNGPVDPWPFVNKTVKTAPAFTSKDLTGYLTYRKGEKGTVLVPLAVTAEGYIAELPDGNVVQTPFSSVKAVPAPPVKSSNMATGRPSTGTQRG